VQALLINGEPYNKLTGAPKEVSISVFRCPTNFTFGCRDGEGSVEAQDNKVKSSKGKDVK
jgi:hypothetical protein